MGKCKACNHDMKSYMKKKNIDRSEFNKIYGFKCPFCGYDNEVKKTVSKDSKGPSSNTDVGEGLA